MRVECHAGVRCVRLARWPVAEAVAPGDLDGHCDRQHVHDARWRCRSGSATGMSRTSTTSWLRRSTRRTTSTSCTWRVTYDSFAGDRTDREPAGGHDAEFAERRGYAQGLSHTSRSSSLGATPSSCSATSWRGRCSRSRRLHPPERPERLRLSRAAAVTARLIDELHLFVHPVLAGSGLRLFEDGTPEWPLGLRSSGVDAWELDRRWRPRPAADGRAGHPTGSGVGRLGSHRRHEAGPGTIDEAAVDGCEQAAAYSRAATALTHRPHQPGPIWLDLIEAVFIVDGHAHDAPRPGP